MNACWTVATQTACLRTFCHSIFHVCWRCASLSALPAGLVSHYQLCMLVWCLTISRACWYDVSPAAIPAGVVLHYKSCLLVRYLIISHACCVVTHYRPCLLLWCLTVGHVFWCCAPLYAMPVGVVTHYRPCLLVHFALQPTFCLVECRGKRDGCKSDATLTEVSLRQTYLLIRCHSQICLLVQCNSIRHACWVHLSSYMSL